MKISYKQLLIEIGRAKQQLDTLKIGSYAYRDYKKYYDKLLKEKNDYQALIGD